MIELIEKIKRHAWDAEPDDTRAMAERLEIMRHLRALPLSTLSEILKRLGERHSAEVLKLIGGLP